MKVCAASFYLISNGCFCFRITLVCYLKDLDYVLKTKNKSILRLRDNNLNILLFSTNQIVHILYFRDNKIYAVCYEKEKWNVK